MNDILNAVGISAIPPGESEASLLRKTLTSQIVYNRTLEYLVATHAADVIRAMPKLERDTLRNKLVPSKDTKPEVTWVFTPPDRTIGGKMFITATCGSESAHWNGDGRKVHEFVFHGHHVPGDIQEIYRLHASATAPDPDAVRDARDRMQWAHDAQAKRMTPEEILIKEQYGEPIVIK